MYKFADIQIENPINIIFLCGARFDENKEQELIDKRIVLKEYLEENKKNKALILEENFIFSKRLTEDKLSYKDISINNLFKIEAITAICCDGVIIIHETESTAAELGVFASNSSMKNKICILQPHEYAVDRRPISTFLSMSFSDIKRIEFYPLTRKYQASDNVSNYTTYFNQNKVGINLGRQLDDFLSGNINKNLICEIIENKFNKNYSNKNTILVKANEITINLDLNTIKHYVFSLFCIKEFRKEIKETTDIKETFNITYKWFDLLIMNTVKSKLKKIVEDYKFNYSVNNFYHIDLKVKDIISYSLYILHAIKLITLPYEGSKFKIAKRGISNFYDELGSLICSENYIDLGDI